MSSSSYSFLKGIFRQNEKWLKQYFPSIYLITIQKNLTRLGIYFNTDKAVGHSYTEHYGLHFKKLRKKKISLLEIGVGGYESSKAGGNSLKMWKRYFSKGKIYSIDIYDKTELQEKRIQIFQGSQVDKEFLEGVVKETGALDVIIDDGSHINNHVIESFKILFPKLKCGGIYVVEDTQTSYWEDYGGNSKNLNSSPSGMNYFKSLADGLNHKEYILENFDPSYFDKNIVSMHFYHNLIFIYKGENKEESNLVNNNQRLKIK